jgi:transposase-like protein
MAVKSVDPRNAMFHDEDKARDYFEAQRWSGVPVCPHCQSKHVTRLEGGKHRAGLIQCNSCLGQFTVMTGTVMESSHIPLAKWALAFHKMAASKKGISAKQLQRELALGSYRTAWFMAHRIREAMRPKEFTPMGGDGQFVEADETFVGTREGDGGKKAHRARIRMRQGGAAHKNVVLTLVERGGSARSFHIESTRVADIVPILRTNVRRESRLMTDEANQYKAVGKEFATHDAVFHGAEEYVRGGYIHTNTVEGYYSIFKRGMIGVYRKHPVRAAARLDVEGSHLGGDRRRPRGKGVIPARTDVMP